MSINEWAKRWATTWEQAWMAADVDTIAALYTDDAIYRSGPDREPEIGGARGYLTRVLFDESDVRCYFGHPIASGQRAAVEWWAMLHDSGQSITLAGTTVLTFNDDGLVINHVDYWTQLEGRVEPFDGWNNCAPPIR
jgi:nuclear transport factor 2 (NTF2) superfamily protein